VPAPSLAPGESVGLVGGQPDPNLRTQASGTQLLVSGTGYALSLGATDSSGTSQQMTSNGALRVPTGGGLRVGGSGFAPDGYVDVFLDPPTTSRLAYAIARLLPRASFSLGRVSVDAAGDVTGSIQFPVDAPTGSRVLQIVGRTGDDRALVLSVGIEVASSQSRTIMITATRGVGRQKPVIIVRGTSTGLVGREITVRAWSGGRLGYANSPARPVVREDGNFTWRMRATGPVRVYATVLVDGVRVRSNAVAVRGLR